MTSVTTLRSPWRIAETDQERGALFMPSVGEYPIYDDAAYTAMIEDQARMDLLRAGLKRHLSGPGADQKTVVELGSGSQAPWAHLALELGAGRAVAVEQLDEVRRELSEQVAQDPAQPAIEVFAGDEYRAALTRAEVIVAEVIGTIGSSEGAEQTIGREIEHWGSTAIVPEQCVTFAAGFSWRSILRGHPPAFIPRSAPYLEALHRDFGDVDVRICVAPRITPMGLLTAREPVETCRFVPGQALVSAQTVRTRFTRSGDLDSVLLSVRLEEGEAAADSMVPGSSWLPLVAPLSGEPVRVAAGGTLVVDLHRQAGAGSPCPDYIVEVRVEDPDGTPVAQRTADLPWRSTAMGGTDLHQALRHG